MAESSASKLGAAVEIMKRGGVLLGEKCPKCGGLQVRFKERVFCLNCSPSLDVAQVESSSESNVMVSLKSLTLQKLAKAAEQLDGELEVEKQTAIVTLILKYLEILNHLSKSAEAK